MPLHLNFHRAAILCGCNWEVVTPTVVTVIQCAGLGQISRLKWKHWVFGTFFSLPLLLTICLDCLDLLPLNCPLSFDTARTER